MNAKRSSLQDQNSFSFSPDFEYGWYCPRCDMFHPRNMSCGPEHLVWDKKGKDYIGVGQKLSYFQ